MRSFAFIFLILSAFIVFGNVQSHTDGFIVLNSGDTLIGNIRKPSASYILHHQITFRPVNEKDTYKFDPNELKSFKVGGDLYQSHYIWSGKKLEKKFLKPIVSGYCTLYEYAYAATTSKGMVSAPIKNYFAERQNERLHLLNFKALKKGKDKFFGDNPALNADIRSGKYTKDQLPEIVSRYNSEKFLP